MKGYKHVKSINYKTLKSYIIVLIILFISLSLVVTAKDYNLKDYKASSTLLTPTKPMIEAIDLTTLYELDPNNDFYTFNTVLMTNDEIQTYYLSLAIEDKLLVIAIDEQYDFESKPSIYGRFATIDPLLVAHLEDELSYIKPKVDFEFYEVAFIQDLRSFTRPFKFYFEAIFCLGLCMLIVLIKMLRTIYLPTSKLYKLAKEHGDPKVILTEIENELNHESYVKHSSIYILKRFIIIRTFMSIKLIALDEVTSCYIKPFNKNQMVLKTVSGHDVEISKNVRIVQGIYDALLKQQHSWTFGYEETS